MNITYDGHIFRWQKYGGISRYFREVISRLPADWKPTILGENRRGNLPTHPRLVASGKCSIRPRRLTQPIKAWWWKQRHVRRTDIFHPTYYNLTGCLRYEDIGCPVIVTVHDLIFATYPHLDDAADTVRDMRAALARADHAICVSHYTEQDLLEHFPRMAGKTSVIHHGTSFPVIESAAVAEPFERPTFLFVGNRGTYKNFNMLLSAFAKACKSHGRIQLCIAGRPLNEDEKWQIHFSGVANRVDSVVWPDEDRLAELYLGSVALLYPSSHEGFGIPPLEAMACGTLAVTANNTSLPEVVGDAGIMLDPADESAWTDTILAVANQQIDRASLLDRGRCRATQFSWASSARKHVEIYQRHL